MLASRVVKVAEQEVGYLEKKTNASLDDKIANAGSNNFTKYSRDLIKWIGKPYAQGVAWCDMFFDWCVCKACIDEYGAIDGIAKAKYLLRGWSAYTPTSAKYYKDNKQWYTTPKVGDQIFFKNSQRICHTGIVYKVDNKNVYTIEGNTSGASGVVANGGGVKKKCYALGYSSIAGYGRPEYDSETVQNITETEPYKEIKAKQSASSFNKIYAGIYKTTANLNLRDGAGKDKLSLVVLDKNTTVKCFGYYSLCSKVAWLYVQAIKNGITYTGFVSKSYLRKQV